MPLPISEQIAANVLATIAGVTVANGYAYTLAATRHARAGDKRMHLTAAIVQDDPKPAKDGDVPNTVEWIIPFGVGVYVIPEETDSTAIDTYRNVITADVQKAMMADRYRGGLAMDTELIPPYLIADGEAKFDLVVIGFEVSYRVSITDPYTNAK